MIINTRKKCPADEPSHRVLSLLSVGLEMWLYDAFPLPCRVINRIQATELRNLLQSGK